jgi:hypothetical protein
MGNHYHLLVETPEANLVSGMKWFQGTYTQRFNAKHRVWGHLFQGRYKSLLIDGEDPSYFQSVATYIHLNPARARLIQVGKAKLEDYPWSSYPAHLRPSRRPDWLVTDRLLSGYGRSDTTAGRQWYRRHMVRLYQESQEQEAKAQNAQWRSIRRGWCLGTEEFREQMEAKLDEILSRNKRTSYTGSEARGHDKRRAEELVQTSLQHLHLEEDDLSRLKKGDTVKKLIAWAVRTQTRVSNEWIVHRLQMGSPSNLSRHVRWVESQKRNRHARDRNQLLELTRNED